MRAPAVLVAIAPVLAAGVAAADDELARHLAAECVSCHLVGAEPQGIPAINGLPQETFIALFDAYRSGERAHALMNTIASRYGDEEVALLAAYFERLGGGEDGN